MDTQSKEDIDRLKQIGGLKSHIEKQKTSSRHSLLNAWDYISKAKLIHEIDINMSAFCLITAEEEAATALIKLIKERGYNCPYNLNHRLHPHKAAVYFLIEAYKNFIIETNALDEILISGLNKDQLELRINLIHMGIDGWFEFSEVPLNISITDPSGNEYDFQSQIDSMVSDANIGKLSKYILKLANQRNMILYASPEGRPSVNINQKYIRTYENRVFTMSFLFVLIAQHKEKQPLVATYTEVLSKLLQRVKDSE